LPKFGPELRRRVIEESKGKCVESLQYVEEDDYWVYTFTDGSEVSVRFMAELQ
jgi:hypothetical protein